MPKAARARVASPRAIAAFCLRLIHASHWQNKRILLKLANNSPAFSLSRVAEKNKLNSKAPNDSQSLHATYLRHDKPEIDPASMAISR